MGEKRDMQRKAKNSSRWGLFLLVVVPMLAAGCAKAIPGAAGPSDEDIQGVAQQACPPGWSFGGIEGLERSRDHDVVTVHCRIRLVSSMAYYAVPIKAVAATGNGPVAALERYVIFASDLPAGQYYDTAAKREILPAGATGLSSKWKAVFRGDLREVPKEIDAKNEIRIINETRMVWTTLAADKLLPPVPPAGPGVVVLTAELVTNADEERNRKWEQFLQSVKFAEQSSDWQVQSEKAQIDMWDQSIRAYRDFPSAVSKYRQYKSDHEQTLQKLLANRYANLRQQMEQEARYHDASLPRSPGAPGG